MFKIGEFSKLSQVTVKTLRYYDESGLLKPAEVDRFTNYRYYSASQLPRLNRILALKDLGLALDQIAQLLEDDLSPDQIRGILRLKQVEIQQQVQEEQARLARVEQRLRQIEQEETMPSQEVVLKNVPAHPVASVRDIAPAYSAAGQFLGEIFAYLGQHRINPVGPPMSIYHDPEYRERDVDVEAAVPIAGTVPEGERVKVYTLPATEMACIVHQGSFDAISGTYGQLMGWVESNGYHIVGPPREVYVQFQEDDPSGNITEIQLPVEKA
jgi:DNA-binding transcriptional MerR regulator/predicted transcriptional regulator YdeE